MTKNLVKAAGLLLIINICVKLLGFLREMVIASGFGASSLTDAYLAAYTLPYFLQSVLGYAFVSAILPELSGCWVEGGDNRRACRLGSTLINITAGGMGVLSLIGILTAKWLIFLTAPGLSGDTEELAVNMARVIFPLMIFMSSGMVVSAILNSRYRFAAAALAPGICSLVIILAVVFLARGNIYVLAWATLAGFVAFFLIQLADLRKIGFHYSFCWDLRDPAVKRVLANIVPIMLALSVTQIYTVVNRIFASGLAEGSISALNYANKLMNLPLGVFVAAIITAAFPALAEKARLADKSEITATVKRGFNMVVLLALPSAVGLTLLDGEIIRFLFERGSFTPANTLLTTEALTTMAPGLFFLAISMLLVRVYFALHDVKTPLLAGIVSVAVNVAISLLLTGAMGVGGLSLANTIAAAVNALWLLAGLARRLPLLNDGMIGKVLLQSCIGSAAMSVPVVLGKLLWPHVSGKLGLAIELAVLMLLAVAVYFAVLKLLHCPAMDDAFRSLLRRNRRKTA